MDIKIEATPRDPSVKAVQIRKQGFVPACVYGHDMKSTPIQIPYAVMHRALETGALKIEVKWGKSSQLVAIEEVQVNPRDRKLVHVAFHALKQNEKTWMYVPLHLVGEAKGKEEGGVLAQQINELNVYGYPKDISDELVIDVAHLELDESIHVSDLVSKFKVEFDSDDLEKTVVVCHYPRIQEIPETVVEEVAAAEATPAEGTPAPAAPVDIDSAKKKAPVEEVKKKAA